MDSVLALPYSEYIASVELSKVLKPRQGYSIFAPLSRQEKGVDLLLCKNDGSKRRVATFQVKASRTYQQTPPKRKGTIRFNYETWFSRFEISDRADFYLLIAFYANDSKLTIKRVKPSWWRTVILVFSRAEMKTFMRAVRTKKGTDDRMFGFGFNTDKEIYLTRGDPKKRPNKSRKDLTKFLIKTKISTIKQFLKSPTARRMS